MTAADKKTTTSLARLVFGAAAAAAIAAAVAVANAAPAPEKVAADDAVDGAASPFADSPDLVDAAASTSGLDDVYVVSEPAPFNQSNISYHGGQVYSQPIDIHIIFYGNHSQDTQRIVFNFVSGLNSSSWWTVARTYWGSTGNVTADVAVAGTYNDNYSLGKSLPSGGAWSVAVSASKAMGWPDPTSFKTFARTPLYLVLLANDVEETGPGGKNCVAFCGYHSGKIMSITDATRCPGTLPSVDGMYKGSPGCMPRYWRNQTDPTYSINRNQHADSMVGVIAHEIIETASDWDQAWTDSKGLECADKCETQYLDVKGIGSTSPYNDAYNVEFGGNRYLIQSLWSATSQRCLLAQP